MKIKPLKSIRQGTKSVKAYVNAIKEGQHVLPSDGAWKVKKSGSEKASRIFDNQQEAIEYARKVAMNQQAELFIHDKIGKIRAKNSYGKDNFPPRG